ncbi:Choline-sulfatase [Planctomycetes bacterium Pla163]|uniref:Choline-sulfatase n=1 Tax=Rohdeia mirabilis TaxID=2528008 RepID=A0A518D4G8_9BACT|nr:Choline-sulfatase [Planctomycetes bacterium Pla163]
MFRCATVLLASVVLSTLARAQSTDPARPNFLVIVWDDVGHEDLVHVPTRTLDLFGPLARRYERFYATPTCSPSRFLLQAGRYPHHDFVGGAMEPLATFEGGLRPNRIALAEVLHSNGYRTAYFGKWHVNGSKFMDVRESARLAGYSTWRAGILGNVVADGVDHYDWVRYDDGKRSNETTYTTRAITDAVTNFLSADLVGGEPFYAQVSYAAPHEPFDAPPASMLPPGYLVLPGNRGGFEASLVALDTALGELVGLLGPLMANTYVVLMSDNGTPHNAPLQGGAYKGYKLTQYEGGIRVPMLVWGVGTQPGVDVELISAVDWPATVLELANVHASHGFEDSISFAPTLAGGSSPREYVWSHRFTPNNGVQPVLSLHRWAVVRDDGMKLWFQDGVEQLFDLSVDPFETTNLGVTNPAYFADVLDLEAFKDSVLTPTTWPY